MATPMAARSLLDDILSTFHEREGEQGWVSSQPANDSAWIRVFGGQYERRWSGDVTPDVDGDTRGLQLGMPVFGIDRDNNQNDRFSLSLGYAQLRGDVRGDVLASDNVVAGKIDLDSYNLGGYWTHVWANQAYLDTVLMYSWLRSDTDSIGQVQASDHGHALTGSVEGGYPWRLDERWSIEPQGQLVWQRVNFDGFHDAYSGVDYQDSNALTGRVGARLIGDFDDGDTHYRPFLRLNLWHDLSGRDSTTFNDVTLSSDRGGTALQFGVGLSMTLRQNMQLYATGDYLTEVDGPKQRELQGRIGFRFVW
jgi:autotransporter family porin